MLANNDNKHGVVLVYVFADSEGDTLPFQTSNYQRFVKELIDGCRQSGLMTIQESETEVTVTSHKMHVAGIKGIVTRVTNGIQQKLSDETLDRIQSRDHHTDLG